MKRHIDSIPVTTPPSFSRVVFFVRRPFDPTRAAAIHAVMSGREKALFHRYITKCDTYFEFGSGGSTAKAAIHARKVYSVESDAAWHAALREKIGPASHIIWLTVDLKVPFNGWGAPGRDSPPSDWPNYTHAYKSDYGADMLLIDGRFRISCALCVFSQITRKNYVLIHDFRPRRPYWVVLHWYDLYEVADSLVVLVKKEGVDPPPVEMIAWYDKQPHDRSRPDESIPPWPIPLVNSTHPGSR
jgi:hypothetical protein